MKKIAWGMTGAGHLLEECVNLALSLSNVDVFLSRAAEEVIGMYHLESRLSLVHVVRDNTYSAPVAGRFARGIYSALIIAPATSNSVAKFVCGISDSLITNLFAQAGKSQVPIVVLPTDIAPEMDSRDPGGNIIKVYPRPVDLENVEKLRQFPGVTVVRNIEELQGWLNIYL